MHGFPFPLKDEPPVIRKQTHRMATLPEHLDGGGVHCGGRWGQQKQVPNATTLQHLDQQQHLRACALSRSRVSVPVTVAEAGGRPAETQCRLVFLTESAAQVCQCPWQADGLGGITLEEVQQFPPPLTVSLDSVIRLQEGGVLLSAALLFYARNTE